MQTIGIRHSHLPATSAVRMAVRDRVAAAGHALHIWWRNIRTRTDLSELDDRMLADLGISRAQADFEIHRTPWR